MHLITEPLKWALISYTLALPTVTSLSHTQTHTHALFAFSVYQHLLRCFAFFLPIFLELLNEIFYLLNKIETSVFSAIILNF